ncbi:MAG: c-type cytochrome domain-containing protein [Myxococcota bacterium]
MRVGRLVILAAACLGAGCDDELFGIADEGSTTPGATGYAGVNEIASANCLGCHGASSAAGSGFGLDLETDLAGATVGVVGGYGVPLVTPQDLEQSMLYLKIAGENPDNTGGAMPPGAALGLGTVDVVAAWIEDGAPAQ